MKALRSRVSKSTIGKREQKFRGDLYDFVEPALPKRGGWSSVYIFPDGKILYRPHTTHMDYAWKVQFGKDTFAMLNKTIRVHLSGSDSEHPIFGENKFLHIEGTPNDGQKERLMEIFNKFRPEMVRLEEPGGQKGKTFKNLTPMEMRRELERLR